MSFFDTLQEATHQERHELFNLPIIAMPWKARSAWKAIGRFSRRPTTTCATPCR
jgi:hypothetical protein